MVLTLNDFGCHINKCFVGCLINSILISASIAGLKIMLDISDMFQLCGLTVFISDFDFVIRSSVSPMKLGSTDIIWVNTIQ